MIYLASKSPRRQQLLSQVHIDFELLDGEVDESVYPGESGEDYCLRVAIAKAEAGWANKLRLKDVPVLAADTTVIYNEQIFAKPLDEADAFAMLTILAGQKHKVLTAVAIKDKYRCLSVLCTTLVTMAPMSVTEIDTYIQSGESLGSAGAYSIQGCMAKYIEYIEGSYSNVVGLPLYETQQLLNQF